MDQIGSRCLVLLPIIFVWFPGLTFGVYDNNTRAEQETQLTSEAVHIPELQSILVKYGFAKFWSLPDKSQQAKQCSRDQLDKIRKCGMEKLYHLVTGSPPREKRERMPFGDFTKALDRVCRFYDTFKVCVKGFQVDTCLAIDKSLSDIVYSYLCGEGKRELETSYTGSCLSKLTRSSVVNIIKRAAGCQNSLNDLTSTIGIMFSMYHDHKHNDSYIKDELPAIRDNLVRLCHSWHILDVCIFPAYAKLCGSPAQQFLHGLLTKVKLDLESHFSPLGQEIADLARCNQKTGERLSKEHLNASNNDGLHAYFRKQFITWKNQELALRISRGPCSAETTTTRMSACFWQAVYDVGPKMADILNIPSRQLMLIRGLQEFGHCYIAPVRACPKESKVDLSDLINHSIQLLKHTDEIFACPGAISLINDGAHSCGVTLSDLGNSYILEGALRYIYASQKCSDDIPLQSSPELSCLTQAFENMPAIMPLREDDCTKHVLPYLIQVIKSFEEVMGQLSVVYKQVFSTCKHTDL